MIKKMMFSFHVGSGNQQSKVTIGGYDLDRFAKGKMHWHSLVNDRYWSLYMKQARLGDKVLDDSVTTIIVDSGTSFFLMPKGISFRS